MIYFCVKIQKDPLYGLNLKKIAERDKQKKIGIGWTNFAAVAIETKKGG
jgi:hypothetical protein